MGRCMVAELENALEAKLNLTGRFEREHAGPDANTIGVMCNGVCTVDRTRSAGKLLPIRSRVNPQIV